MPPTYPVRRGPTVIISGGGSVQGVKIHEPSPKGSWSSDFYTSHVDFDRDLFARTIHGHGVRVRWEKRVQCPSRLGNSPHQSHNFGCTLCDGRGWLFVQPEEIRVLAQSASLDQQYQAQGSWLPGTSLITAMPEYRLGERDRLIELDIIDRYDEILRRQPDTDIDRPKFDIIQVVAADATPGVFYLGWENRSQQLQTFVQNTDFVVTPNGVIRWLTSNRPDADTHYTVSYYYHPYYIITKLLHEHRMQSFGDWRGTPAKFYEYPVQALATKEIEVRDEGRDAPQIVDKDPVAR